jgi:hypothetical protein
MAVLQIRRPEPSMPILKDCFDRFPLFEGGRTLAKRVEDSVELWKARQAGGAVMPAEMECSGYGAGTAVS